MALDLITIIHTAERIGKYTYRFITAEEEMAVYRAVLENTSALVSEVAITIYRVRACVNTGFGARAPGRYSIGYSYPILQVR